MNNKALVFVLGITYFFQCRAIAQEDIFVDLKPVISSFREGASDKIDELLVSTNQSISVASAWQKVRSYLQDDKLAPVFSTTWFVGFLEGKIETSIPSLWRHSLLSGRFLNDGAFNPTFADLEALPAEIVWNADFRIWVSSGYNLTRTADGIQISRENERVKVSTDFLPPSYLGGGIAVHCDETTGFVVFYCRDTMIKSSIISVPLAKADNKLAPEINWRTSVASSGAAMIRGPIVEGKSETWNNVVYISSNATHVFVFGFSTSAVFCEGFLKTTGERTVVFTTSWWDNSPLNAIKRKEKRKGPPGSRR